MKRSISYIVDGNKYELAAEYRHLTNIHWHTGRVPYRCSLLPEGLLTIRRGYTWDGPSGPAIDTVSFMRASLVHDALYELMRVGALPQYYRKQADQEMRRIAKEDGMGFFRRWYTYWAVRLFAAHAAKGKDNA